MATSNLNIMEQHRGPWHDAIHMMTDNKLSVIIAFQEPNTEEFTVYYRENATEVDA